MTKWILSALMALTACSQLEPQVESDLQFCHSDDQCAIHRTSCGRVVAFNVKFQKFVEEEFKKREAGRTCHQPPDTKRHRAVCERNACSLISF
jgi:hypothetical protein